MLGRPVHLDMLGRMIPRGFDSGSNSLRAFNPVRRSASAIDARARIRPLYRLQISFVVRDDDPGVEDLGSSHSSAGLSQVGSALGPGTSDKIPSRQDQVEGSPLPPPPQRVSRDKRGRISAAPLFAASTDTETAETQPATRSKEEPMSALGGDGVVRYRPPRSR